MTATITSNGRVALVPKQPLPARSPALGIPELHAVPLADGRCELRDDRGESFGLFANEQLARATAAFLTR